MTQTEFNQPTRRRHRAAAGPTQPGDRRPREHRRDGGPSAAHQPVRLHHPVRRDRTAAPRDPDAHGRGDPRNAPRIHPPVDRNDQSINEHTGPAADPLEITASLEQQQHGCLVETTLIGPPEIRVNCRVEDVLADLPGLDHAAEFYLTELPSHSKHHATVGRVAVRPVPYLGREALDPPGRVPADSRTLDEAREAVARHPRDLPEPFEPNVRTWMAAQSNHPRELSRNRPDARAIVVRGTPMVIRSDTLDWAEQISAIMAVGLDAVGVVAW